MTTKTITGTYSAGYILNAKYRVLYITETAYIGGAGLQTTARATIDNSGTIAATTDGASGAVLIHGGLFENQPTGAVSGGAGGAGIFLAKSGRIDNAGGLCGGAGESGYDGGAGVSAVGYANLLSLYGAIEGGAGGGGATGSAGGAGGDGVLFSSRGVVANSATISGGLGGRGGDAAEPSGTGGAGGVGGAGIRLSAGGYVANQYFVLGGAGGGAGDGYAGQQAAEGGAGVSAASNATVQNDFGLIRGGDGGGGASGDLGGRSSPGGRGAAGGAGVDLYGGGTVSNSGAIYGGGGGEGGYGLAHGGAGGAGGVGVAIAGRGAVYNGGLISGGAGGAGGGDRAGRTGPDGQSGIGVYAAAGDVTVVSDGTISGGAYSVLLTAASDVLVVEAGSQFIGAIEGGGGTIEISGFGTVTGLGGKAVLTGSDSARFSGFGAYQFGPGVFDLSGANRLAAGQSLTIDSVLSVGGSLSTSSAATITIDDGGVLAFTGPAKTVAASLTNNGVLETQGARITVDGALNGGGIAVIDGGTLDFQAGFVQDVVFTGKTGVLEMAKAAFYTGSISGFAANGKDTLDLGDISFHSPDEARFVGTSGGGVLVVTGGKFVAEITLVGDYLGDQFTAASDGHGGTDVTASTTAPAPLSPHPMISAMAGLGAGGGALVSAPPRLAYESALFAPRCAAR